MPLHIMALNHAVTNIMLGVCGVQLPQGGEAQLPEGQHVQVGLVPALTDVSALLIAAR